MLQFTPLQTTDKDYSFVENLLHESFPEAERRDDVAQRDNVDNCAAFTCYLISEDELLVGLYYSVEVCRLLLCGASGYFSICAQ